MATPLTAAEFTDLMAAVGLTDPNKPLAVAVSGGADSLCLGILAAQWGQRVRCLHVDHGLRPSSAQEANQVARWLSAWGIDHEVLKWTGPKPSTNVQAAAREARYRLLETHCAQHQIPALLLGHHQDDQAETFLLRLARGSGLAGLSGMAGVSGPVVRRDDGPQRLRPLLTIAKDRLIATLEAMEQPFIDDPSNNDDRFDRVAIRQFLQAPPLDGLSAARLARTAEHLRRAQVAIDEAVLELANRAVKVERAGYFLLDLPGWTSAPEEVRLRLLAGLLAAFSSKGMAPRFDALEGVAAALEDTDFAGRTVGGTMIFPYADQHIAICREPKASEGPVTVPSGGEIRWDGRFIAKNTGDRSVVIASLGEGGLADARRLGWDISSVSGLPKPVRDALPACWQGGALVGIPYIEDKGSIRVRCVLRYP